jgi:hypothetical protein
MERRFLIFLSGNRKRIYWITGTLMLLWLPVFILVSCSAAGSGKAITRIAGGQLRSRMCRIVLLPFVNESRSQQLDIQAYRIFLAEIVESGIFAVTPEGDLKDFFYRNRISPQTIWDRKLIATLSQQLDVDGALVVYIRDSNLVRGSDGSKQTFISLQVELHDARSGKLILSSFLRRRGSDYTKVLHFGVVDTVSGLLQRMAREIIEIWEEEGVSGC